MIIAVIYDLAIWLVQHGIVNNLPVNLPGISIADFSSGITNFSNALGGPLYVLNCFFPWNLFILLVRDLVYLEIILWIIRLIITGINMARGSGARV